MDQLYTTHIEQRKHAKTFAGQRTQADKTMSLRISNKIYVDIDDKLY